LPKTAEKLAGMAREMSPSTGNAGALSSWRDGPVKRAIIAFVADVTAQGSSNFVPPAERVATFDNDGTLWCEQPLQPQFFFIIDRVKALAAKDPTLKDRQPFKALLEEDYQALRGFGKQALIQLGFAAHAGMTETEFATIARDWLATAKHPKLGRLFTQCTFRPQIELLAYLRENGFATHIVSGGGIDFIRAFSDSAYGILPSNVIGSSVKTQYNISNGQAVLLKLAEFDSFNDREAKPQNIALHIGRRPILAFGNSDGDVPMLRYTKTGPGARLALVLHHDDGEREVAYDREFELSPLADGLDSAGEYGITVVSMERDWDTVFGS